MSKNILNSLIQYQADKYQCITVEWTQMKRNDTQNRYGIYLSVDRNYRSFHIIFKIIM